MVAKVRGRCLASQEIRELVGRGILAGEIDESNIQPSSLEPTIGSEVYVLDTESGLFHPRDDRTVYRSLLELPERKRSRRNISDGFELKIGGTYLFPLNETLKKTTGHDFVRSSPKSSIGRVFPSTRFLTDFNSSYDEATVFLKEDIKGWLLVQPTAFNLLVGPGLALNQLRFFKGYDASMNPQEIRDLWDKSPLLFSKGLEGKLGGAINPRIAEALQLHLDLEGRGSEGIVALRARKNPDAVDLRKKKAHLAEEYFEPMKARDGEMIIQPGEHYLMASKEVLNILGDMNAELKAHSHQGIRGTLHEAGFIDNGFRGDLVFEITSHESTGVKLRDKMPIGELMIYRTKFTDKLYGKENGSHYSGQTGPKVAKYFTDFDFASAAKNHLRLNREVLVQDREFFDKHPQGFGFLKGRKNIERLFADVESGFFHSRYDCEKDDSVVQPIPYVVLFDGDGKVFCYRRAVNEKNDGDVRLFGNYSIGLGGHIQRADSPNLVRTCVSRELEKDVYTEGEISRPKLIGTLRCNGQDVDRYHFGLVFGAKATGQVYPKDSAMATGGMIRIENLGNYEGLESWSRSLVPYLKSIEKIIG